MSLSEGDNLLLWCGWWDAQTSDSVENPAGVSRARKVWSSSPELETSNRPFYSHHPSISLLSQSVMGTWLDYWGPNGSSFFSRLVDWIRYTFRQQRMMGWLSNQGLIQGFTSQILIPILPTQTIFESNKKVIIGPAIGQEKAKVENIIVWDLWSNQNYQKIPELKQLHKHNDVVPKGEKKYPFLYQLVTQVLCRKHRRLWTYSGSKGRALGMWLVFHP